MQQVVAQIPWSHNVVLMEKTKVKEDKLPSPTNKIAVDSLKDPYIFDLITLREEMNERDIERQ